MNNRFGLVLTSHVHKHVIHVRKHALSGSTASSTPTQSSWDVQPATQNSGTAAYGIGCIMLIFRIVHADLKPEGYRDFALVCIMQVANRSAAGPFPRFDSENRCEGAHLDDPNTNHKLGRLWTWKLLREQRTYRVLSANEILETVAIMPRFQQGSE